MSERPDIRNGNERRNVVEDIDNSRAIFEIREIPMMMTKERAKMVTLHEESKLSMINPEKQIRNVVIFSKQNIHSGEPIMELKIDD